MTTGAAMKTLTALLILSFAASGAHAQSAFKELLSGSAVIDSGDIALAQAAPVPANRLPGGLESGFKDAAAMADLDAEKAARLAAIAAERLDYGLKGKCYAWVWKDLMAAGFPYEASVPDPSAFQFAVWAKEDAARARAFGVKIIPTPDSYEELPAGAILVYGPGRQFAYGTANDVHGHIEIVTDVGGTRYGCSDGCWELGGRGDFLKTPEGKAGVTVLIPVR